MHWRHNHARHNTGTHQAPDIQGSASVQRSPLALGVAQWVLHKGYLLPDAAEHVEPGLASQRAVPEQVLPLLQEERSKPWSTANNGKGDSGNFLWVKPQPLLELRCTARHHEGHDADAAPTHA